MANEVTNPTDTQNTNIKYLDYNGLQYFYEKIKAQIDSKLTANVTYKVVDVLPATGESGIIYLADAEDGEGTNVKLEWMWINNAWELIGSTEADLSGYVTTSELNTALTPITEGVNTAKSDAAQAKTDATKAKEDAASAVTTADEANTTATSAVTTATEAKEAAITAQDSATAKAAEAAASATAAATSENNAADYATAAGNAKDAAVTAQGKAEEAQSAAETAKEAAETAQGKAETAQAAAEDAQKAAEDAADRADKDLSDAVEASEAAQEAAEAAEKTAEGLATDYNTWKSSFVAITNSEIDEMCGVSNSGSTEGSEENSQG